MHPQLQQLVNLSLLLLLGKYTAHIYLSWLNIIALLIFTLFIEHAFLYLKNKKLTHVSFSALSTAIGVILMMASPHLWVYMVVITLGLLQKQFLVVFIDNKSWHFFNPSNFSLLMGLLLFYQEAHLILGQLGDDLRLQGLVGLLALFMLIKVDRWIIPLAFCATYLLFQYFLVIQYDPVMIFESLYQRFYSVSLIVFICFMLTDPKTTPHKQLHQVIFAIFIALVATLFDRFNGFRVQHLFFALALSSIFTPLTLQVIQKKQLLIKTFLILLAVIGVIIYIGMKAPYYFSMDS
jgi:hypothetical protein